MESRERGGQPVPPVLGHQAAIRVGREVRDPPVVVGERARLRGNLCAPLLHRLLDDALDERGIRRDGVALRRVEVDERLPGRVERRDGGGRMRGGRLAADGPPADVQVRHHELPERVCVADGGGEIVGRAPDRVGRQEVGIAQIVAVELERDRVDQCGRREPGELRLPLCERVQALPEVGLDQRGAHERVEARADLRREAGVRVDAVVGAVGGDRFLHGIADPQPHGRARPGRAVRDPRVEDVDQAVRLVRAAAGVPMPVAELDRRDRARRRVHGLERDVAAGDVERQEVGDPQARRVLEHRVAHA